MYTPSGFYLKPTLNMKVLYLCMHCIKRVLVGYDTTSSTVTYYVVVEFLPLPNQAVFDSSVAGVRVLLVEKSH